MKNLFLILFIAIASLHCAATEPVIGNITGRLLTPNGSGLANIEIILFDFTSRQYTNISQPDGAFVFTVPAGNWHLYIPPEQIPDFIRPTREFSIIENTNITGIEAKLLARDATITGSIKDPNGQPVSGIKVYANRYVENQYEGYATDPGVTDDAGNFTITAAKGAWFVYADCANLIFRSFDCVSGSTVDAASGSATVDFSLTTGPQPTIESPRMEITRIGDTDLYEEVLFFTLRGEPGGYDIQSVGRLNYSWTDADFVTIPQGATSVEVRYYIGLLPTLPYPTLPKAEFLRIRRRLAAP